MAVPKKKNGGKDGTQRKRYSTELKARVALEAIKEQKTVNEIAGQYGVHPNLVGKWKKQLKEESSRIFAEPSQDRDAEEETLKASLYQQIGQLKVELDWLKKNPAWGSNEKRLLVEPDSEILSIARQCELIGLSRSSWYYQPAQESALNLELMNLLDEQYTRTPYYGIRKMTDYLKKLGYEVNHKRVGRLMRKMGLEAIYPKPRLSQPAEGAQIYPYLLKSIVIERSDQVWSTDITYLRLRGGFAYLVAIIDWFSRYVLSWALSNTLEASFCLEALADALRISRPEIFNSDQGSQFTSLDYTGRLKDEGIRISMGRRGRALDNIFVERLWRTIKYENAYLNDYGNMREAAQRLKAYLSFYNEERPHQSLGYRTPAAVYFEK